MKLLLIFLLKIVSSRWCVLNSSDNAYVYDIDIDECRKICGGGDCVYTTSYSYYNEYTNGKIIIKKN